MVLNLGHGWCPQHTGTALEHHPNEDTGEFRCFARWPASHQPCNEPAIERVPGAYGGGNFSGPSRELELMICCEHSNAVVAAFDCHTSTNHRTSCLNCGVEIAGQCRYLDFVAKQPRESRKKVPKVVQPEPGENGADVDRKSVV